jgi:hypothetical protein
MALQNVDGVLTGRGLMDCLQYYDICLYLNETVRQCYFKAFLTSKYKQQFKAGLTLFVHGEVAAVALNLQ